MQQLAADPAQSADNGGPDQIREVGEQENGSENAQGLLPEGRCIDARLTRFTAYGRSATARSICSTDAES